MSNADALAAALDGLTERQATNIDIVRAICEGIGDRLIEHIRSGKVPADWDGHEIRELIFDNAERCRSTQMMDKRTKRYREYERVCLTTPGLR